MIEVKHLEPKLACEMMAEIAQEHAGKVVGIPLAEGLQVIYVTPPDSQPEWVLVLNTDTGEAVQLSFTSSPLASNPRWYC